MIKKHPIITVVLILLAILILYLLFNLLSPHYISYYQEDIVVIDGVDYDERWDWQVINKEKYVGIVSPVNSSFWERIELFPRRLYTVKGDEKNISYFVAPSKLSEFHWGYHLYRADIVLPKLDDINPYRIELGQYFFNYPLTDSEAYYYIEDKDFIDEIMSVIRDTDTIIVEYSQDEIGELEKVNDKGYQICLFTDQVPGSVYEIYVKQDGYQAFIDINSSKEIEEYKDITYVIHKMITEGQKVKTD